jgi:hypothetical protein
MLTRNEVIQQIHDGKILIASILLEDVLNFIETSYPVALTDETYLDFVVYKVVYDYDIHYIKYVYKFKNQNVLNGFNCEFPDSDIIPQQEFLTHLNNERKVYLKEQLEYNLPDCKLENWKLKI